MSPSNKLTPPAQVYSIAVGRVFLGRSNTPFLRLEIRFDSLFRAHLFFLSRSSSTVLVKGVEGCVPFNPVDVLQTSYCNGFGQSLGLYLHNTR